MPRNQRARIKVEVFLCHAVLTEDLHPLFLRHELEQIRPAEVAEVAHRLLDTPGHVLREQVPPTPTTSPVRVSCEGTCRVFAIATRSRSAPMMKSCCSFSAT